MEVLGIQKKTRTAAVAAHPDDRLASRQGHETNDAEDRERNSGEERLEEIVDVSTHLKVEQAGEDERDRRKATKAPPRPAKRDR